MKPLLSTAAEAQLYVASTVRVANTGSDMWQCCAHYTAYNREQLIKQQLGAHLEVQSMHLSIDSSHPACHELLILG
jgi:hypothetical protein